MYFHDRAEAGDKLADELIGYRWENTAVLALSPGGVAVGERIAARLHCTLSLLLAGRNIIIATDGVKNGLSFDAALHYLGRVRVEKTIAAIPVGPAEVIERLH